jgi:hypothetical protein
MARGGLSRLTASGIVGWLLAILRRRPMFAYPMQSHHRGLGDVNDPRSFTGRPPAGPPDDRYEWAGASR